MKSKAKIVIRRQNNFFYSFADSNNDGKRFVAKALSFPNPSPYAYSPYIRMFDRRLFQFRIGMLRTVISQAREHSVPIQIEDQEYSLPKNIKIDPRLCTPDRNYQQNAVENFFDKRFGILKVPTRGGKTFIAAEIVRIFLATESGQVCFVVDSVTLFQQAYDDFTKYFTNYGGIDIGEIKAGKVDTSKRFTLAMRQTLQSQLLRKNTKHKRELNKYWRNLQFLIVDEIHDNCSDACLKLYKQALKLDYQLCLSATPYRQETYQQNIKLQAWSGDIIYEITEETLRRKGVLSDYKVFLIAVDHNHIDYDIQVEDYAEYRQKLIFESNVRNRALDYAIRLLDYLQIKTLVLFTSVEHGNIISQQTHQPFISGSTRNSDREKAKQEFLSKKGGVLLASNIFKKGVTLPECQAVILADEGLEAAQIIQKKGRVLGVTANKNRSAVIDFIDIFDLYFSEHSEARLNTYVEQIGEDNVGILDVTAEDFKPTLEKWIRRWFNV